MQSVSSLDLAVITCDKHRHVCRHGGVCVEIAPSLDKPFAHLTCHCPPRWTGRFCDKPSHYRVYMILSIVLTFVAIVFFAWFIILYNRRSTNKHMEKYYIVSPFLETKPEKSVKKQAADHYKFHSKGIVKAAREDVKDNLNATKLRESRQVKKYNEILPAINIQESSPPSHVMPTSSHHQHHSDEHDLYSLIDDDTYMMPPDCDAPLIPSAEHINPNSTRTLPSLPQIESTSTEQRYDVCASVDAPSTTSTAQYQNIAPSGKAPRQRSSSTVRRRSAPYAPYRRASQQYPVAATPRDSGSDMYMAMNEEGSSSRQGEATYEALQAQQPAVDTDVYSKYEGVAQQVLQKIREKCNAMTLDSEDPYDDCQAEDQADKTLIDERDDGVYDDCESQHPVTKTIETQTSWLSKKIESNLKLGDKPISEGESSGSDPLEDIFHGTFGAGSDSPRLGKCHLVKKLIHRLEGEDEDTLLDDNSSNKTAQKPALPPKPSHLCKRSLKDRVVLASSSDASPPLGSPGYLTEQQANELRAVTTSAPSSDWTEVPPCSTCPDDHRDFLDFHCLSSGDSYHDVNADHPYTVQQ